MEAEIKKTEVVGLERNASNTTGVLNLQDDDLKWSLSNDNRNKVHNKFNVFESSPNHPLSLSLRKKLSSMKLVPGAK